MTDYAKAREVAEEAREQWIRPSFGKQLFLGDFRLDLVYPAPPEPEAAVAKGEEFLRVLTEFLRERVDPMAIERNAMIPDEVVKGLAEIGAFGMTIGEEYGGLGLSHYLLLPGPRAHRLVLPRAVRPPLRAPVDRGAQADSALRHGGAEAAVPAPVRAR